MSPLLLMPVGAYLAASIPFGLLIGWMHGVDVRTLGSKNIGATNVGRCLGRKWGVLVFALDFLKGLAPSLVAGRVLRSDLAFGKSGAANELYLWWLAVVIACVLGHTKSIFLRFKGGKGVATSLGAVMGIWPVMTVPGFLAFGVWLAAVWAWRYVSLGSILGTASFPIFYFAVGRHLADGGLSRQWALVVCSLLIPLYVLFLHRPNIKRLLAGAEPQTSFLKPSSRRSPDGGLDQTPPAGSSL